MSTSYDNRFFREATPKEVQQAVEQLSVDLLHIQATGDGLDFIERVRVLLEDNERQAARIAELEGECEELKSALAPFCIPGGDNTLEAFADLEPCVVVGLGLVAGDFRKARAACGPVSAMHYRRDYCPAGCKLEELDRAEKAEARCEALETCLRRCRQCQQSAGACKDCLYAAALRAVEG